MKFTHIYGKKIIVKSEKFSYIRNVFVGFKDKFMKTVDFINSYNRLKDRVFI